MDGTKALTQRQAMQIGWMEENRGIGQGPRERRVCLLPKSSGLVSTNCLMMKCGQQLSACEGLKLQERLCADSYA
jgi:hypothetical protein